MNIIKSDNQFGEVKVTTESLIPVQHYLSARQIQRSTDCYFQKFIKFPYIAIFHSYAELLHAALLESQANVTSFVPQPLSLLVQNRRYIPDCYYLHRTQRYVAEIKPAGKFQEKFTIPLERFFKPQGIKFKTISNESILEKERLALNWLYIIRTLLSAESLNTKNEENKIVEKLSIDGDSEIGDIVSVGDRLKQNKNEVGLFRLAHRGAIKLDVNVKAISYSTGVEL